MRDANPFVRFAGALSLIAAAVSAATVPMPAVADSSGVSQAAVPQLIVLSSQTSAVGDHATAVAEAIAGQVSAAVGGQAGVSVSNVSATSKSVSMNVDVSVAAEGGEWRVNRFLVLPIGIKQASEGPQSLVAPLATRVSRILIEDVAKRIGDNAALSGRIADAAARIAALGPADIGG